MNTYNHKQETPSTAWEVKHNLSAIPVSDVSVYVGQKLVKVNPLRVEYVDAQNLIIRFSSPQRGEARMFGSYVFAAPVPGVEEEKFNTIYSTWNPDDKAPGMVLTESNLYAKSGSQGGSGVRSTLGVSTGKWYWEAEITEQGRYGNVMGITEASAPLNSIWNSTSKYYLWYTNDDNKPMAKMYTTPTSRVDFGYPTVVGDIVGFALDLDNGSLQIFKNGVSQGTVPVTKGITYYAFVSDPSGSPVPGARFNFGQNAFKQQVPANFTPGIVYKIPLPGEDPNWDNVSLMMPLSSNVDDKSGRAFTAVGSTPPKYVADEKFGSVVYFNGANLLSTPHTPDIDLRSGDYTVECWFKMDAVAGFQEIITKGAGIQLYLDTSYFRVALSATNTTSYFVNSPIAENARIIQNAWNLGGLVKRGNVYEVYLNGKRIYSVAAAGIVSTGTSPLIIGGYSGNTLNFKGRVAEVRITNGLALYNGDFTPLAGPFPRATIK